MLPSLRFIGADWCDLVIRLLNHLWLIRLFQLAFSFGSYAGSACWRVGVNPVFQIDITLDEAVKFEFGLRVIVMSLMAIIFSLRVGRAQFFHLSVRGMNHLMIISLSVAVESCLYLFAECAGINLRVLMRVRYADMVIWIHMVHFENSMVLQHAVHFVVVLVRELSDNI